jgi:hypothetical protein
MSGVEAAIMASAGVILWWLESIRQTLKDCLATFKESSEKIHSDLHDIENEIRAR